MTALSQEEADQTLAKWARGKTEFPSVRNLMGFLAVAELAGTAHGQPTGTKFIKRAGRIDLDALYAAAVAAITAAQQRRRAAPRHQKLRKRSG
jgi:hypothetical protein